MKVRYVIYADFEALNIKKNEVMSEKVKKFAEHEPSGYGITVIDTYATDKCVVLTEKYRGINVIPKFTARINQISLNLKANLSMKVKMNKLTPEEVLVHDKCDTCHICRKAIYKHQQKVRDHCHVTGLYRGACTF